MSHSNEQRHDDSIDILLVEDNPGDVRLTKEAFAATDHDTTFHVVTDGDAAIEFLRERTADGTLPDFALVDLNLPRRDGCAVVEAIRTEPLLQHLPTIILTSSSAEEDVVRCYDANANAYLTKPKEYGEFVSVAETIERFWFRQAQLPPTPA